MTVDAVEGYVRVGGDGFWSLKGLGYGGGSVARWADPEGHPDLWEGFDGALADQEGTVSVWWELCTSGSGQDNLENALLVLTHLEERLPAAAIYVSAQPGYTNGHVCDLAGPEGPERMDQLAEDLTRVSDVRAGPNLAPLSPDQLIDGCHAGPDGKSQMGQELLKFFGT